MGNAGRNKKRKVKRGPLWVSGGRADSITVPETPIFFSRTKTSPGFLGTAQVGFRGLLEMSRDTWWNADPMLPSRSLSGTLEVVGTRHSSPGIRRLVKAVAGGLRACQVSAWLFSPVPRML